MTARYYFYTGQPQLMTLQFITAFLNQYLHHHLSGIDHFTRKQSASWKMNKILKFTQSYEYQDQFFCDFCNTNFLWFLQYPIAGKLWGTISVKIQIFSPEVISVSIKSANSKFLWSSWNGFMKVVKATPTLLNCMLAYLMRYH